MKVSMYSDDDLPVNTSTVLLTCKILQIYFDKLKLTSHNCYDGLLNATEASSVHCDGSKLLKYYFPRCAPPSQVYMSCSWAGKGGVVGTMVPQKRAGGKAPDYRRVIPLLPSSTKN